MNISDFIEDLIDMFEDTPAEDITPEANFKDFDDWDSLAALNIIALAKTKYGKTVKAVEIRACDSVDDLFNLITTN